MATARPLFKVCLLLKKDRVVHHSCRRLHRLRQLFHRILKKWRDRIVSRKRLPSGTGIQILMRQCVKNKQLRNSTLINDYHSTKSG